LGILDKTLDTNFQRWELIGFVVGLVAITPAAGFVSIPHAIFIGIFSSIVSNLVVSKFPKKIDDALDVFACHGVGGMTGMLLTGVFASKAVNSAVTDQGLIFGETTLFIHQLTALLYPYLLSQHLISYSLLLTRSRRYE
jgi:Amt family ammonium transporter